MAQNPLQQFFRQPKIYIKFPSEGAYTNPGVLQGNTSNAPVYGMTGMDEILIKTPDALISGESTVKVIESCCPVVKNAWEINNLDVEVLLTAIRIATYGDAITITHVCEHCKEESDYELGLSKLIEHFGSIKYDNQVVLKDVVVRLQPLTYRQVTDFGLKNFQLQQRLKQVASVENEDDRQKQVSDIYVEFALLQNEIYSASIEAVEANGQVVDEKSYINEWILNTDKISMDKVRAKVDENRDKWKNPPQTVTCPECGKDNTVVIELDHSDFFANA